VTALVDETLRRLDDCGCCSGTGASVPGVVFNRPGLSAIAYRSATWHEFRSSLLAALSHRDHPRLAALTTRDADDFTIALLDAVAAMGDVLTFFGERIASESYLRTATERRSILELARLIGYELKPGVAAGTLLAFTVEDPPVPIGQAHVGQALAPRLAIVDPGVKVQSIPGHEEKPQTFETVERIEARPAWNSLRPRRVGPQVITASPASLVLTGTETKLQPGDALLLVTGALGTSIADKDWEARRVATVSPDFATSRTEVTLDPGSANATFAPSGPVHVYAMRTHAPAFGYNAADWKTLSASFKKAYLGKPDSYVLTESDLAEWPGFSQVFTTAVSSTTTSAALDLEAVHPVSSGTWLVLATPPASRLYSVTSTQESGLTGFAISSRVTRVALTGSGFDVFDGTRRDLVVHGQSDELTLADVEIEPSVTGDTAEIALDQLVTELPAGRTLLLTGTDAATKEAVSEEVILDRVDAGGGVSTLVLTTVPKHSYELASLAIHANVARATHGESVEEVLGSGNAGVAFQRFTLRQPPVTYVRNEGAAGGAASTLGIRVNELLWQEVASFFGRTPTDRVFVTRQDDEGRTEVLFGDGVNGARLSTGQENIKAAYRKGTGLGGNVRAGQLLTLLTKPLGIKEATNPAPAVGGDDPESRDASRENAPLTVLTLDRVVSLRDYEDFARGYAGITKALATWSWDGEHRGVFVTVAGPDGTAVDDEVADLLAGSIRDKGDPYVPLGVATYRAATFTTAFHLKVDPVFDKAKVQAAVVDGLRDTFGFRARAFGQPVALSEVIAAIARVAGVVGVDVDSLARTDGVGGSGLDEPLPAALPGAGALGAIQAAELLTLASDPIAPGEMT
jgi:predicted phage baseplate assembly protein